MSELIAHFGINGKLLIAQAINFLLLFFLLKRFAFRPLLAMLRKRREEIEAGYAMRAKAQTELAAADQLRAQTLGAARAEALGIIEAAQQSATERQDEILAAAGHKSEIIISEAKRAARSEHDAALANVAQETEQLVERGIARVLGKMNPEERDRALIHEAMQELRGLAQEPS